MDSVDGMDWIDLPAQVECSTGFWLKRPGSGGDAQISAKERKQAQISAKKV